jgi:hypothetical protein
MKKVEATFAILVFVLAVRNYGYMMPTHVDTTSPASNGPYENV